jgi:hypothetical protein
MDGSYTVVANFAQLPTDDFNDNRRGAMWRLTTDNSEKTVVSEYTQRLNLMAASQMNLPPYCIGHWKMNDNDANKTVVDSSGTSHNGTAYHDTNTLSTTGKINGALTFNGTNDYVSLGTILGSGSYTKAAWIRLESSTTTYGQNILSGKPSQAFWAPSTYSNKLSAGHNGVWNQVQDPCSLASGVWYFVALTYNAGTNTLTLYKNGTVVSTGSTATPQALTELNIGRYDSTATYLKGTVDNVMLFNKVLTGDEIAALYNGSSGTETMPKYTSHSSEYSANGWGIDANEDFQTKVDFHYDTAGSSAAWVGMTIHKDLNNYISIQAGADGNVPYFWYEKIIDGNVVSSAQTSRASNDGTLYISYNAALDELYLSYSGYGAADAWQTITGLLAGRWLSEPLSIDLGGGTDGGGIDDGQAYMDNFEVTTGVPVGWPPATDLDASGFIDFGDILVMSENWLETGEDIPGDVYKDENNIVNFFDFAELGLAW